MDLNLAQMFWKEIKKKKINGDYATSFTPEQFVALVLAPRSAGADVQTIHGKMKVTGLLSELNEIVLTSRH